MITHIRTDELDPVVEAHDQLCDRVDEAVKAAITALYLYDMGRGPRGCFYDIVEALDPEKFGELNVGGAEGVYHLYYAEGDE